MEEHCDDPLADKEDTKLNCHDDPLDLTIEADRQLRQPDIATDDAYSQAKVEDDSHLPTEAQLEAEIEKVKDGVIKDLMLYNKKRQWECRACEKILGSPHWLRHHILLSHFEGPLENCRFCRVFCKTEALLKKHMSRKHKHERDMERSR